MDNTVNNTFYLYVTGIAYSIQYMNYWKDSILPSILDKIPFRFNSIEIVYYDPILEISISNSEFRLEYINRCNEILITNSDESNTEIFRRIKKKEFLVEIFPIPFEPKSSNYLIVDFAHIFKHTHIHIPLKKIPHSHVFYELTNRIYNYKVLYLGYLGEQQYNNGFYNRTIIETNFLNIDSDDNLITWIDHLKIRGYDFKEIYSDYVTDIIANFTTPAYKILRKKYTDKWIKPDRSNALDTFDFFEKQIFRNNETIIKPLATIYIDFSHDLTFKTIDILLNKFIEPKDIIETLVSMYEKEILCIEP